MPSRTVDVKILEILLNNVGLFPGNYLYHPFLFFKYKIINVLNCNIE